MDFIEFAESCGWEFQSYAIELEETEEIDIDELYCDYGSPVG